MPVFKFRTVEALNREIWRRPGDPELYRVMDGLWAAGSRLRPATFEPGVHRFRSIEALDAATPKWRNAPRAGKPAPTQP
jgi:hypothetical protein